MIDSDPYASPKHAVTSNDKSRADGAITFVYDTWIDTKGHEVRWWLATFRCEWDALDYVEQQMREHPGWHLHAERSAVRHGRANRL